MNQHSPVLAGMAGPALFMMWSRPDQIRFLAVRTWRVNQANGGFFGTFLGPSQESTAVRAGHGRSESDWISAFLLLSFSVFKKNKRWIFITALALSPAFHPIISMSQSDLTAPRS